ncbi:cation diffusion facilitator family transporter [Streptacidiphilus albus]|uniref:cation diffusion facilitator family transporter n=1 Tax=Streptacidiphilus albus TaxID=105425 RepID=UPI0005A5DED3|nr:cation diffusion facilitator family transporter [Streptacidiphilus albus]
MNQHPHHDPAHHDHPHHDHDAHHGRDTHHGHEHHDHPHPHGHGGSWAERRHRLGHLLKPHRHETADMVDPALESSAEGLRTLWISLAGLAVTAALQAVVVLLSGSVSLLGDAVHNVADALTALPLGIAFLLGRRAATRRFTYGFGRAEDLAGVAIVLTVAASAAVSAWVAVDRLLHPRAVGYLPAVAAAALVGFAGNELVARYRIRTGRRIGSAALVADGVHARTDGFTSLAVLVGAGGAAIGWRWADPLVGLLITLAILGVLAGTVREVFRRLMDAVDPALVDAAESALVAVDGVAGVGQVRMRWIGHRLRAEVAITVDGELNLHAAHGVAVAAEQALLEAVPRLVAAHVHADPLQGHAPHPVLPPVLQPVGR